MSEATGEVLTLTEDRLVRRVARAGYADYGLDLSIETLWPEPAPPPTAPGGTPSPCATLNDTDRDRSTALASFAAPEDQLQRMTVPSGNVYE